jgi:hypothetical protein
MPSADRTGTRAKDARRARSVKAEGDNGWLTLPRPPLARPAYPRRASDAGARARSPARPPCRFRTGQAPEALLNRFPDDAIPIQVSAIQERVRELPGREPETVYLVPRVLLDAP